MRWVEKRSNRRNALASSHAQVWLSMVIVLTMLAGLATAALAEDGDGDDGDPGIAESAMPEIPTVPPVPTLPPPVPTPTPGVSSPPSVSPTPTPVPTQEPAQPAVRVAGTESEPIDPEGSSADGQTLVNRSTDTQTGERKSTDDGGEPVNTDSVEITSSTAPDALQGGEQVEAAYTYTVTTPRTGTVMDAELRHADGSLATGWWLADQRTQTSGAGEIVFTEAATLDVGEVPGSLSPLPPPRSIPSIASHSTSPALRLPLPEARSA